MKKPTYLLLCASFVYLLTACKPEFDLNAPYKDVTIVYGILNYQDSINYVKIYKGFQSDKPGAVFLDARNPDSIYYYDFNTQKSLINVVLREFDNNKWIKDIPLDITHDFPRDTGFFYFDKEKIIYYTKEPLNVDRAYKIQITHKNSNNITEGETNMVGGFETNIYSSTLDMLRESMGIIFTEAKNAERYQFFVSFIYFEVSKTTNKILKIGKITRNLTSNIGEEPAKTHYGELVKYFTPTFYSDIAGGLKPDQTVTRYIGYPGTNGSCIEIDGWATGKSLVDFLLSNRPTSTFIQINTKYTNMTSTDGFAFGVLSSRSRLTTRLFATSQPSEDSLIYGSKTRHLGFRPWVEYKP
jgi:hypothetical protein